jgi:hypothetical protein
LKTKIITLESHDNLISVRDQLSWAKTSRILLVWPKFEEVSLRLLDLKVLQRYAESLGAQLGLVTRRKDVRRDAEALGIPVFESTGTAQRTPWPVRMLKRRRIVKSPRRDLRALRSVSIPIEEKWRSNLAVRVFTFAAGVLAVIVLAGLFIPRAEMTLYPETQVQKVVIPVVAAPDTPSVSITGSVPARFLKIEDSLQQTIPINSKISTPQSKARGIARFTNLTQTEIEIPAGSVVNSAGDVPVRFVTLQAASLPSGPDGFVDVSIEAELAGSSGNLAADTIRGIEGPLGLSAVVTNLQPTSGGADLQVTGPAEEDRTRLHATVVSNLQQDAITKMRSQFEQDDLFLSDTFVAMQILEEVFDPPAGRAGKSLTLTMRVEYQAQFISAQDLQQLALTSLDASMPMDYTASGPILLTPLIIETDAEGVTRFDLQATRTLLRKLDLIKVNEQVRGQRYETALHDLGANLPLRKAAQIELHPSWWPWMPLIPFNISVLMR